MSPHTIGRYYHHAPSGLQLALYRAYDPNLGRWLSEDPIGEEGGINLYGFVGNQATNATDPLGLADITEMTRGSSDLHVNMGRGNTPAFDIKPTVDAANQVRGLHACPRPNHAFPANAQDLLRQKMADPKWYNHTRDLIRNAFEVTRRQATRENLRQLGQGLRRGTEAGVKRAAACLRAAGKGARMSPMWLGIEAFFENEFGRGPWGDGSA